LTQSYKTDIVYLLIYYNYIYIYVCVRYLIHIILHVRIVRSTHLLIQHEHWLWQKQHRIADNISMNWPLCLTKTWRKNCCHKHKKTATDFFPLTLKITKLTINIFRLSFRSNQPLLFFTPKKRKFKKYTKSTIN